MLLLMVSRTRESRLTWRRRGKHRARQTWSSLDIHPRLPQLVWLFKNPNQARSSPALALLPKEELNTENRGPKLQKRWKPLVGWLNQVGPLQSFWLSGSGCG